MKLDLNIRENLKKEMTYIILIGQRSAGKGTFAEYANQEHCLDILVFSAVLEEIGLEMGIVTQSEVQKDIKKSQSKIGTTLRNNPRYGNEFHTMRIVEKIRGTPYILDGMRHPEELEILKRELSGVSTVGIFADYEIRCHRSIECGSAKNPEHFAQLEKMVSESPITGLLKNADYRLENNGSVKDYYEEIGDVLTKLI